MIRVGIIGIGFMGYTHFEGARDLVGGKVTAIATRDPRKLQGDWTSIQGNFGPPGGHVDLSDIKKYSDYRELLQDPDIDLVDICLPTDQHHSVVMETIRAGKALLVEKPISVDLGEAKEMVAEAEKRGTRLLVAHVLPFFPEFRFASEAIRSGVHGRLLAAHFKRVICRPNWSGDMSDFRKLGGWGIDLHVHDNHFIAHACGRPEGVFSRGLMQDGFVNHVHTSYVYGANGPTVTSVSGGIAASGLQFAHGFELYFENATMLFDAGTLGGQWVVSRPLTLITSDGRVENPGLDGGKWCSAFTHELQTAVDAIRDKKSAGPLEGTVALDALRMCWAEAESIAGGKTVSL